jgi:hypothetical protein
MARLVERQGYAFYACDRCDFAYKEAATADQCALFDREHGMRSADITGNSIAPPQRHYQAVPKFVEEELKAAKAKAAAAAKAAAGPAAPTAPVATAAGAAPVPPAGATPAKAAMTPEELEARKKAALEKAAAAKAAKAAGQA